MAILLQADEVTIEKPDWGWHVLWGTQGQVIDEKYLALQRADVFTEQDRRFGHDKPYIECCGQGWSWYGHILLFELHRGCVKVQLDQEAAQHMKNDGAIDVTFDLDDPGFLKLADALLMVFRGFNYYRSHAQPDRSSRETG